MSEQYFSITQSVQFHQSIRRTDNWLTMKQLVDQYGQEDHLDRCVGLVWSLPRRSTRSHLTATPSRSAVHGLLVRPVQRLPFVPIARAKMSRGEEGGAWAETVAPTTPHTPQEADETLENSLLDVRPNPQNPKRKQYRVIEDKATRTWSRNNKTEVHGSLWCENNKPRALVGRGNCVVKIATQHQRLARRKSAPGSLVRPGRLSP